MSLPRVITVDPAWALSKTLHAVLDLTERSLIQVDVPDSANALRELKSGCQLMLMSFQIDAETKGFLFAAQVHRQSPETAIIVIGDVDDPEEFDKETADESPFIYLRRPLDPLKFIRVIMAALDGGDIKMALNPASAGAPSINYDMGPVPFLDVNAASRVMETLLVDVGAMALVLATRTGEVLLERGAVGYVNREKLTKALTPAILSAVDVKEIVGGQMYTVQFYDGDNYDIFVLAVGLHHFLSVIYDGQNGIRQFGGINRYGRRAVEDLIALIGAQAFFVQRTVVTPTESLRQRPVKKQQDDEPQVQLERASLEGLAPVQEEPAPVVDPIHATPDDLAALFAGDGGSDGMGDLDFLNMDEIEDIANQTQQNQKGRLGWEEAKKIGLF